MKVDPTQPYATRITRLFSHVEQGLLNLPVHLSSTPVFSGGRVAQSLIFCEMCCRSLLVCPSAFFSFGHCIVCLRFMSFYLAPDDFFFYYLSFRYVDYERIDKMLFQKRVVCTK
jgi:hypothetical protein